MEIFGKHFVFLLFYYIVADAVGFCRIIPNAGSMILDMPVTQLTSA
jgi:hypothetical protein